MTRLPDTDLAVSASGLVKTFGDFRAVDGIDLEVRRGEVFGVLGPNGAGKTTMLKMLATLIPIDAGEASIFGVDVRRQPHMIRQLVGVTGQYASVDENLTGSENLWLFGRLQGLSSRKAKATASDLLERFGLTDARDKQIKTFSGGMRRRLDLAVAASGLVKTFGDFRAVDGIDLEVRRGEVFGVLGPNGAGKTTTLKMLEIGRAHVGTPVTSLSRMPSSA